MNDKTNRGLVEYVKSQLGRPYWYGTYGQTATEKLLEQKVVQYPKLYTKSRKEKAKKEHLGQRVHDCMGLVKGYLWSSTPDGKPSYKSSQDWNADTAYEKATEKGPISTIPELEGILVRYKGHVGVYIGGGEVIEARGFDYGIVKTKLSARKWTHWYKFSLIRYEEKTTQDNEVIKEFTYQVNPGDTLSKIAKKYGTTVKAIAEANHISNPNLIHPGQVLTIPNNNSNTKNSMRGTVTTRTSALNIRSEASIDSTILGTLQKGTKVEVLDYTNGFYKLANRDGFVSARYITLDI